MIHMDCLLKNCVVVGGDELSILLLSQENNVNITVKPKITLNCLNIKTSLNINKTKKIQLFL